MMFSHNWVQELSGYSHTPVKGYPVDDFFATFRYTTYNCEARRIKMELRDRIINTKKEALRAIEKAAKKGDITTVIVNTRIVEDAERLMKNWNDLETTLGAIENSARIPARIERSDSDEGELRPGMMCDPPRKQIMHGLKRIGTWLFKKKEGRECTTQQRSLFGIVTTPQRQPKQRFFGFPFKPCCGNTKMMRFFMLNFFNLFQHLVKSMR
jgi:hypothetical protein